MRCQTRWKRHASAPAAVALALALAATPATARPPQAVAPVATLQPDNAALAMMLADPEQAIAFLADPACLQQLQAMAPAREPGVFDAALATLETLLSLDEMRPRVQLALGLLHHRLGFDGAAQGYLLAALADATLPASFRERAGEALRLTRAPGTAVARGRLLGSLTAGLRFAPTDDFSPWQDGAPVLRETFLQATASHRFDTGFAGIAWESGLQAQATQLFAADAGDPSWLAFSTGPRLPLAPVGLPGGVRLLGGVDLGTVADRLDRTGAGASLLFDGPLFDGPLFDGAVTGGNLALGVDWRQRRYYDSAASPDNAGRSGRELAGRLGYDFRVLDWLAGSASARFADYRARRPSESYSEWQFGLALNADALPALADQAMMLVSTQQWHLGLLEMEESATGADGSALLPPSLSFRLEGGYTRRDTPATLPDSAHWYGRTGLAWQF